MNGARVLVSKTGWRSRNDVSSVLGYNNRVRWSRDPVINISKRAWNPAYCGSADGWIALSLTELGIPFATSRRDRTKKNDRA